MRYWKQKYTGGSYGVERYLVDFSLEGDGQDFWVEGEELVDGKLLHLSRLGQELKRQYEIEHHIENL